tara:strand:- start:1542 stop:2324 length:783 start_codon:yes stop_codon:yes gene_type:complete
MKIRTLLVDDEPLALERIRTMLSSIDDVLVIGECSSGSETVDAISNENPDLVFLDINLPDLDGFEILSELTAESVELPLIIFQTAFDHHAIRAFEVNAVDYLLKPFRRERLKEAIAKARKLLEAGALNEPSTQVHKWLADERGRRIKEQSDYLQKIEIRDRGEILYLAVEEIDYFQADGNYIEVHTPSTMHLWRQTLGKLEGKLDPTNFIRISRSVVIPVDRVSSIETPARGEVWINLHSSVRLALSRNLSGLRDLLKSP